MNIFKKNAFIVLLVLAVIYVYAPQSRKDSVKLPWLDEIAFIITSLAPAKPEAGVSPVDPVAAAQVAEDLDYRIAQQIGSIEGWRSFLAAHVNGPHVQSARAEVEKLLRAEGPPTPAEKPPEPVAALVSNGEPPATKAASEAVPAQPSETEAATLATDEICKRDGALLERLSSNPTIDEAMRFGDELRCEKLRPEVFRLTERLDYEGPSVAVAPPVSPSKIASAQIAGQRATQIKTRWVVSPRSLQPRRHANRCPARSACSWRSQSLPPILLALFGDKRRNSALFVRMRISGGPGGVGTSGASSGVGGVGSTSAATSAAAAGGSSGGPGGGDPGGGSGGVGDGDGNGNGHGGAGASGSNGHGGSGGGGGSGNGGH